MVNNKRTCYECSHYTVCGIVGIVDEAILKSAHFEEGYMNEIAVSMAKECLEYKPKEKK